VGLEMGIERVVLRYGYRRVRLSVSFWSLVTVWLQFTSGDIEICILPCVVLYFLGAGTCLRANVILLDITETLHVMFIFLDDASSYV
jgi:hypothetical protein